MKVLMMTLSLLVATSLWAQDDVDTSWTKGGAASLNFTQSAYSNWAAGGDNAVAGNAFFNLFADYLEGKHSWTNSVEAAYGLNWTESLNDIRKTDDRLEFDSKYGYDVGNKWYLSSLLHGLTQFTDGLEFPTDSTQNIISQAFAPAYLDWGLGMDWLPNENFSLYLSPATAKWTFVGSELIRGQAVDTVDGTAVGRYGVDVGKTTRTEFGGSIRAEYRQDLTETVFFSTNLKLFSNYLDRPQNIDVNWDALITAQIWKVLSLSLKMEMIFDNDVFVADFDEDPSGETLKNGVVQFKEVFGIGISYNFGASQAE
jgi:hypothetical protein